MAKKTTETQKVEKKAVAKKPAPKKRAKTAPKQPKMTSQEVRVVVEHQTPQPLSPALLEQAIAPEKQGSKFMLAPSWISEKQVLKILQRTPKEHIHTRKGRGGQEFEYVKGGYIKKVLNFAFGWNWDFYIIKQEIFGLNEGWGQIVTTGRLVVKDDKGHTVTKEQNGSADVKYIKDSVEKGKPRPVDLGDDFKASATDALKKCASEFGLASDVYNKNEFKDVSASQNEDKVETLYQQIEAMIEGANNANSLKAINLSITNNATLSEEEKTKLYDLIIEKANKLGLDITA